VPFHCLREILHGPDTESLPEDAQGPGSHPGNVEQLDERPGNGCLQVVEFPERSGGGDLPDLSGYLDSYARDPGQFLFVESGNREGESLDLPCRPLVSPDPVSVASRDLE
jgi:hypothetical protein